MGTGNLIVFLILTGVIVIYLLNNIIDYSRLYVPINRWTMNRSFTIKRVNQKIMESSTWSHKRLKNVLGEELYKEIPKALLKLDSKWLDEALYDDKLTNSHLAEVTQLLETITDLIDSETVDFNTSVRDTRIAIRNLLRKEDLY